MSHSTTSKALVEASLWQKPNKNIEKIDETIVLTLWYRWYDGCNQINVTNFFFVHNFATY